MVTTGCSCSSPSVSRSCVQGRTRRKKVEEQVVCRRKYTAIRSTSPGWRTTPCRDIFWGGGSCRPRGSAWPRSPVAGKGHRSFSKHEDFEA